MLSYFHDHVALRYARSRLVLASAAGERAAPLDGATVEVTDARRLNRDIAHARRLGFGGKLCVHPRQIAAVRAGFAPTDAELRWARQIVAATGASACHIR
jgi:citrate lyase subunit beta/citryl-CoA lyase